MLEIVYIFWYLRITQLLLVKQLSEGYNTDFAWCPDGDRGSVSLFGRWRNRGVIPVGESHWAAGPLADPWPGPGQWGFLTPCLSLECTLAGHSHCGIPFSGCSLERTVWGGDHLVLCWFEILSPAFFVKSPIAGGQGETRGKRQAPSGCSVSILISKRNL